jgi:hypothetical protein
MTEESTLLNEDAASTGTATSTAVGDMNGMDINQEEPPSLSSATSTCTKGPVDNTLIGDNSIKDDLHDHVHIQDKSHNAGVRSSNGSIDSSDTVSTNCSGSTKISNAPDITGGGNENDSGSSNENINNEEILTARNGSLPTQTQRDLNNPSSNSNTKTKPTKKSKLSYVPSKLGRKGDPRMHKALKARLDNPTLSLLDALVSGGFEFFRKNGISYDKDNVQLGQRKNQLSRRLRLYRLSQKGSTNKRGRDQDDKSVSSSATSSKRKRNDGGTYNNESFPSPDDDGANGNSNHNHDDEMKTTNPCQSQQGHYGFVPPQMVYNQQKGSSSDDSLPSLSQGNNNSNMAMQFMSAVAAAGQNNPDGINQMLPFHLNNMMLNMPGMGGVSTKDSCDYRQKMVGLSNAGNSSTMPSICMNKVNRINNSSNCRNNNCSNGLNKSNNDDKNSTTSTPASSMSNSLPASSTVTGIADDKIQKLHHALNLYRFDSSAMMKRCMLSAGFTHLETEECDEMYLLFGGLALENEKKRLDRIRLRMNRVPSLMKNTPTTIYDESSHSTANTYPSDQNDVVNSGNTCTANASARSSSVLNSGNTCTANASARLSSVLNSGNTCTANASLAKCPNSSSNTDHNLPRSVHAQAPCHPYIASLGGDEQAASAGSQHESHSHDHSHDHGHSHSQPAQSCKNNTQEGVSKSVLCNNQHKHRLEGKCGHKAIIHKPSNGNAHIDFVIDGKIECYENCQPMIDNSSSAFWLSQFKCDKDHRCQKNQLLVSYLFFSFLHFNLEYT